MQQLVVDAAVATGKPVVVVCLSGGSVTIGECLTMLPISVFDVSAVSLANTISTVLRPMHSNMCSLGRDEGISCVRPLHHRFNAQLTVLMPLSKCQEVYFRRQST